MIDLLLEGLSSAWLPCSLMLLVPGVAAALAAGEELVPSLIGFMVAATLLSWLRFADRGGNWPIGVAALALVAATALYFIPVFVSTGTMATVAGILAGGAAAEMWEPCVGPELGRLLNELPSQGWGGLGSATVFLVGVLAPIIGLGIGLRLAPLWIMESIQGTLAVIGGAMLAVMGLAAAAGFHDEVISKLFQWSLT
ncbi:MAG: hypothetical protein GY724_08375 [Actinomycetia bacterium]|nr:hypothetical protein [Actinomycetes bacterium]MCP4223927.1 hypothetical protein [Actinomycetes bacterium]MCP5031508.1 hypothetical protein [Actinomycetes bacterium]